ncbi:zinc finger protein 316 [Cheilinus undulatus]|uniref:zinc finger protein 316 n=1 Tax=Cheilinus undulatus TaxID=241271 RepID=UPI001BD32F99|nr:zinc finger protein 316 [Cheilinus undulatus]
MNGAVYISFFQGQLESVLEQVVQLAVQEISKTVGSSLNTLLLETAVKEQENHRLRLQLQSWENRGRANASPADSGGSPAAGKHKAAGDERADRTKPEQKQQQRQQHAPGGQGTEHGIPTDTRRLEQRGRVVDQLKSVMEQVLDFAVRELTKIVEASFDDLLLEITKMEREQQVLEERLNKSSGKGGGEKGRGGGGRRRGSENDSVSPSGSEDAREELVDITGSKETTGRDDSERPPVLSVSQDWVPILDKVFGQKWCSEGGEGGGHSENEVQHPLSSSSVTLEPSPSSPQQDPRWTPLEDMEVFSPDEEEGPKNSGSNRGSNTTRGPSPGPPSSPSGSSGRRSSASMLHRLLTLPSQLLEDDDEEAAATSETLAAFATNGEEPPVPICRSAKKRRRVWSECEECGRRFSRMSLLKAHRQTHIAENAAADTSSPSSPPSGSSSALRCSECGKRFSSATRLHSHIRTQHTGHRS